MKPVCLYLALSLIVVPALAPSLAAQPADPAPDDNRISRLEILADLWGKLWLFHPAIVTTDIDWDRVLIDTIPKVEGARSTDELVAVLNESLLAQLDDPLSIVFRSDTAAPTTSAPRLSAKRLSRDVGYVNASNPDEYWQSDFSKRFKDAVNELGGVSKLVVDLRFSSVTQTPVEWTGQALLVNLLNWFVDEEVETASRLVRVHEGWNQNNAPYDFGISVYAQRWKTIPGSILRPNPLLSKLA